MADAERGLHVDFVCSESAKGVVSVTSAGRRTRVLRCGLVRAAHDLGEQTTETQPDRWHASADDSDLAFDDRPETGFEVVPRHVGRVGEVDEGA